MTFRADGRWGGRLTSRPLLRGDATVDALSDEARHELAAVWLARSATERRVADAFEVIRDAMQELRLERTLVQIAERAVDDEYRHEEICRFVASRFAGTELDTPSRLELIVPEHRGADRRLKLALWIVGQCCMNETIASAFLEATVATSSGPMARGALKELLSDEVDHARVGWAFLAALPEQQRRAIGPWLMAMMRANLKMWRDSPRAYPATDELAAQGAPREHVIEQALLTAVRELVIPGLEHFELPTSAIRSWLDEGAPTD